MAKYVSSSESESSDCEKPTTTLSDGEVEEESLKRKYFERDLLQEGGPPGEGPPGYNDTILYDKPCKVIDLPITPCPVTDVDITFPKASVQAYQKQQQKRQQRLKQQHNPLGQHQHHQHQHREKLEMEAIMFRVKVSSYLETEDSRSRFYRALRNYHENKDVKKLVKSLKRILNTEKTKTLFKEVKPLLASEHLLLYEKLTETNKNDERLIKIKKKGEESLGFSFRGGKEHGIGFYVTAVTSGSLAHAAGLKAADEIIRVNGLPLHETFHEELCCIVKTRTAITLLVKNVGKIPRKHNGEIIWTKVDGDDPLNEQATMIPHETQDLSQTDRLVSFSVGTEGIGCSIRNGVEQHKGIYIVSITEDSLADKVHLRIGDQILDVNGKSLLNVKHKEAIQALKGKSHITMIVRYNEEANKILTKPVVKEIKPILITTPRDEKTEKKATFGKKPVIDVIEFDPEDDEPLDDESDNEAVIPDPSNFDYPEEFLQGREVHFVPVPKTGALDIDLARRNKRITVVSIGRGGAVDQQGFIQRNDWLLNVEGDDLLDVSLQQAKEILISAMKRWSKYIELIIACPAGRKPMNLPSKEETAEIIKQPQFSLKPASRFVTNNQEKMDALKNGFDSPKENTARRNFPALENHIKSRTVSAVTSNPAVSSNRLVSSSRPMAKSNGPPPPPPIRADAPEWRENRKPNVEDSSQPDHIAHSSLAQPSTFNQFKTKDHQSTSFQQTTSFQQRQQPSNHQPTTSNYQPKSSQNQPTSHQQSTESMTPPRPVNSIIGEEVREDDNFSIKELIKLRNGESRESIIKSRSATTSFKKRNQAPPVPITTSQETLSSIQSPTTTSTPVVASVEQDKNQSPSQKLKSRPLVSSVSESSKETIHDIGKPDNTRSASFAVKKEETPNELKDVKRSNSVLNAREMFQKQNLVEGMDDEPPRERTRTNSVLESRNKFEKNTSSDVLTETVPKKRTTSFSNVKETSETYVEAHKEKTNSLSNSKDKFERQNSGELSNDTPRDSISSMFKPKSERQNSTPRDRTNSFSKFERQNSGEISNEPFRERGSSVASARDRFEMQNLVDDVIPRSKSENQDENLDFIVSDNNKNEIATTDENKFSKRTFIKDKRDAFLQNSTNSYSKEPEKTSEKPVVNKQQEIQESSQEKEEPDVPKDLVSSGRDFFQRKNDEAAKEMKSSSKTNDEVKSNSKKENEVKKKQSAPPKPPRLTSPDLFYDPKLGGNDTKNDSQSTAEIAIAQPPEDPHSARTPRDIFMASHEEFQKNGTEAYSKHDSAYTKQFLAEEEDPVASRTQSLVMKQTHPEALQAQMAMAQILGNKNEVKRNVSFKEDNTNTIESIVPEHKHNENKSSPDYQELELPDKHEMFSKYAKSNVPSIIVQDVNDVKKYETEDTSPPYSSQEKKNYYLTSIEDNEKISMEDQANVVITDLDDYLTKPDLSSTTNIEAKPLSTSAETFEESSDGIEKVSSTSKVKELSESYNDLNASADLGSSIFSSYEEKDSEQKSVPLSTNDQVILEDETPYVRPSGNVKEIKRKALFGDYESKQQSEEPQTISKPVPVQTNLQEIKRKAGFDGYEATIEPQTSTDFGGSIFSPYEKNTSSKIELSTTEEITVESEPIYTRPSANVKEIKRNAAFGKQALNGYEAKLVRKSPQPTTTRTAIKTSFEEIKENAKIGSSIFNGDETDLVIESQPKSQSNFEEKKRAADLGGSISGGEHTNNVTIESSSTAIKETKRNFDSNINQAKKPVAKSTSQPSEITTTNNIDEIKNNSVFGKDRNRSSERNEFQTTTGSSKVQQMLNNMNNEQQDNRTVSTPSSNKPPLKRADSNDLISTDSEYNSKNQKEVTKPAPTKPVERNLLPSKINARKGSYKPTVQTTPPTVSSSDQMRDFIKDISMNPQIEESPIMQKKPTNKLATVETVIEPRKEMSEIMATFRGKEGNSANFKNPRFKIREETPQVSPRDQQQKALQENNKPLVIEDKKQEFRKNVASWVSPDAPTGKKSPSKLVNYKAETPSPITDVLVEEKKKTGPSSVKKPPPSWVTQNQAHVKLEEILATKHNSIKTKNQPEKPQQMKNDPDTRPDSNSKKRSSVKNDSSSWILQAESHQPLHTTQNQVEDQQKSGNINNNNKIAADKIEQPAPKISDNPSVIITPSGKEIKSILSKNKKTNPKKVQFSNFVSVGVAGPREPIIQEQSSITSNNNQKSTQNHQPQQQQQNQQSQVKQHSETNGNPASQNTQTHNINNIVDKINNSNDYINVANKNTSSNNEKSTPTPTPSSTRQSLQQAKQRFHNSSTDLASKLQVGDNERLSYTTQRHNEMNTQQRPGWFTDVRSTNSNTDKAPSGKPFESIPTF